MMQRIAWGFWAYLLGVIVLGAWVRIASAGDGCGTDWPTCHGDWVPGSAVFKTQLEYAHRVTSGVLGPWALWLWWRARQKPVVWAAGLVVVWVGFEGAIGAGLVLKGLVASNASMARAWMVAVHLCNTLVLVGAATLLARDWDKKSNVHRPPTGWWVLTGLFVLTAAAGAVTALGDTLFPPQAWSQQDGTGLGGIWQGLQGHIRHDLSSGQHFLVRLRMFHPLLALTSAVLLLRAAARARGNRCFIAALCASLILGVANVLAEAPVVLQLLHLLAAQLVWAAWVDLGWRGARPEA